MISNYSKYLKNIFKIAIPIIMGNLGFVMIGVGDVIVAGRHSTNTLAAISLATAVTNCLMMFGIGILVSTSAILSNYRGEGKEAQKYFFPSIKFAMVLAVISSSVMLGCIPVIDKIGFDPVLAPMVKDYFFITAFAVFGGYLHCAMKEYLQSFEIVVFPNLITVFCVFLNVLLNIIFVFGWGIIPEMGVIGLALSSLIIRYLMGIILLVYCVKKISVKYYKDFNYYKDMLKVGLPASIAIMIEFTGFNIITVIMGRVAGIYAAAHNLVCTLTNVSFMIPLAISNATAVKVGFENGAKNIFELKNYAWTGISASVIFMACSSVIFGLFPEFLTSLFTKDPELVAVCVPVVFILCFFQIFDGLQVTFSGIFKGMKKTKVVMVSNFIAYWIISFPIGYILAFKYNLQLLGFWYGLLTSSVIVCLIMLISMLMRFKKLSQEV